MFWSPWLHELPACAVLTLQQFIGGIIIGFSAEMIPLQRLAGPISNASEVVGDCQ
jgi:hypothetical protein